MNTYYFIIPSDFNRHWFGKLGIIGRTLSELEFESIKGHSIIQYQKRNVRLPYKD